jgi:hypothetical protein
MTCSLEPWVQQYHSYFDFIELEFPAPASLTQLAAWDGTLTDGTNVLSEDKKSGSAFKLPAVCMCKHRRVLLWGCKRSRTPGQHTSDQTAACSFTTFMSPQAVPHPALAAAPACLCL